MYPHNSLFPLFILIGPLHLARNLARIEGDGKLERTPFTSVVLPKVSKSRLRFLSLKEEQRLLDVLGPIYAPWARLAILTGLRLGEQIHMQWNNVDLEQGLVTLPQTKAEEVQYAPLNAEAQSILRALQIRHMDQGG